MDFEAAFLHKSLFAMLTKEFAFTYIEIYNTIYLRIYFKFKTKYKLFNAIKLIINRCGLNDASEERFGW